MRALTFADRLSSSPFLRWAIYAVSLAFFVLVILIPAVTGVMLKWGLLGETLNNPDLVARARSAIIASFAIAFSVALLDLLAALPMAWLVVRRKSLWVNIVDTLVDIPVVIPTVALGFSSLMFWSRPEGLPGLFGLESIVSPGAALVMLLHFAFSYPTVVRIIVGELESYDQVYEVAARTLGASHLTAVRTVTLPIIKPALVSAFLLAFCRSLSETGATAMVAGAFENGPVFIRNARLAGQEGPLVLVSTVLIFASFAIFVLISVLGPRLRLPLRRVWPGFEKRLSSPSSAKVKDGIALTVFLFFCGLPSLFTAVPGLAALLGGTAASALTGVGVWSGFWISIAYSYGIGLSATLLNLVVGFPMAVLIARRRLGAHFGALLDSLINVPIVIPSIALGVSLNYFWSAFGSLPELWVLILVHTSITYTYFVRAMVAAIEYVPEELEDVARTLGSRPFEVFRKIVLPLTKYSIFAGSIMVLTRSVDETGATIAVARQVKTAPVLLAEWISRPDMYGPSTVGLGVSILVFSAFISLLLMRLVLRRSA